MIDVKIVCLWGSEVLSSIRETQYSILPHRECDCTSGRYSAIHIGDIVLVEGYDMIVLLVYRVAEGYRVRSRVYYVRGPFKS